jgi:NADH dehydrogenase
MKGKKMNNQASAINQNPKILVLGGNGFIGRQIVMQLAGKADVVVGTRKPTAQPNRRTVRMQTMLKVEDWLPLLQGIDVVVNSVGILRERKQESYAQVHTQAVAALANACAQTGTRLIQISALGLSMQAKSRFIRSKYLGEQAILASGANATIVRPSLLDGEGGYGAKWFRRVAMWPLQFVMMSNGRVAPLQVSDLGEAVANLVFLPDCPAIVELGGRESITISSYLDRLRASAGYGPAIQIRVPTLLVRVVSHIFDALNWTPLSFGHFELMQGYNVPVINRLPDLLNRVPTNVGVGLRQVGFVPSGAVQGLVRWLIRGG